MKLFDRVSDDFRSSIARVEALTPNEIRDGRFSKCWVTQNDTNHYVYPYKRFFENRERFEVGVRSNQNGGPDIEVHFTEVVSDGILKTVAGVRLLRGSPSYQPCEAWIKVALGKTESEYDGTVLRDIVASTQKGCGPSKLESRKTVWFVQDFVREKAMDYYLRILDRQREATERARANAEKIDALRSKYLK